MHIFSSFSSSVKLWLLLQMLFVLPLPTSSFVISNKVKSPIVITSTTPNKKSFHTTAKINAQIKRVTYDTITSTRGGSLSEDDDDAEEYDAKAIEVDIIKDKSNLSAKANSAKPMSNDDGFVGRTPTKEEEVGLEEQSKSYFLSSTLWTSLALDTVLNKKKRLLLFPSLSSVKAAATAMTSGAAAVTKTVAERVAEAAADIGERAATAGAATTAATASPTTPLQLLQIPHKSILTTNLALGYALPALIGWMLSLHLKTINTTNDDDYGIANNNETNTSSPSSRLLFVRQRFHLLLFSFALIHLGANLNPFQSAPFHGYVGIMICIHNGLIALNGWRKEVNAEQGEIGLAKELFNGIRSSLKGLLGGLSSTKINNIVGQGNVLSYFLYTIISQISFLRAMTVTVATLIPHYLGRYTKGTLAFTSVDQLRMISLQWTLLGRLLLISGIGLTLKEETENGHLGSRMSRILNGILSTFAFASAIPQFLYGSEKVTARRFILFGVFTGMNAIRKHKKPNTPTTITSSF